MISSKIISDNQAVNYVQGVEINRVKQTINDIQVSNPEVLSHGTVIIKVNGIELSDNRVPMAKGTEMPAFFW